METEGKRLMREAEDAMQAKSKADALKSRLAQARTKDELTSIEDDAYFCAARRPTYKEWFLKIAADTANKRLPPNAAGRKPKYDAAEDARVFNLYQGQPERISIEVFREETDAIKKAFTLMELRRLIDREGKRRRKEIAEKQKAGGRKK